MSEAWESDEGYVYQYVYQNVDRAEALRQLLVRFWWALAICRRNRATMTRVIAEGPAACSRNMCSGSKPDALRPPRSGGPWGFSPVLDNVVSFTALGVAKSSDGGIAPHPCVSLIGTTP